MLLIRPAAVSDVPLLLRFSREFAAYERQPDAVIIEEETLTRVSACAFLVTYLAKLPTSGPLTRVTGLRVNKSAGRNNFQLNRHPEIDGAIEHGFAHQISISPQSGSRSNRPCDGSFQRGCIKRQIRTIEATNIRMIALLLVIHPSIG